MNTSYSPGSLQRPLEPATISSPPVAMTQAVLRRVRAARPLVHNITNQVVMNVTANALLAIGASPAMVHAEEEVVDFVRLAQALVVNIGTLTAPTLRSMMLAAGEAGRRGIPWILDPVGVGATPFRNAAALDLARLGPSVIRANAGEIIALAGVLGHSTREARQKGVDSLSTSDEAIEAAEHLVRETRAVIAVTGATDFVVGRSARQAIPGGHPLSQSVTGTGCMTSALVGACLAVAPPEEAAMAGLAAMKIAAAHAAEERGGPARFAIGLIDQLYHLAHPGE